MISVLVVLLCLELRDVGFKVLGSALSKLCGPVELLNMMLEWLAHIKQDCLKINHGLA